VRSRVGKKQQEGDRQVASVAWTWRGNTQL
jgi:hypothetical protein